MADLGDYIYWPCDEGEGTEIVSVGAHAITLTQNNADDVRSANAGWITLDGGQYFDIDFSSLSTAAKEFISPELGCFFVWAECQLNTGDDYSPVISNTMAIMSIGDASDYFNYRIGVPGADDAYRSTIADGTTTLDNFGNGADAGDIIAVDVPRTIALIIDNRDPQKQTRLMRGQYFNNGTLDLTDCTSLDFTTGKLRIGNNFAATSPAVLQIRNIGIMKLGNSLPFGIDAYMQDLFLNGGVPQAER
jgi:hypothetical protein